VIEVVLAQAFDARGKIGRVEIDGRHDSTPVRGKRCARQSDKASG
jgi:hypothetical protein